MTASTLAFGGDLAVVIDGPSVDTQYTQLNVAGQVDLTGVALVLSGSYAPGIADYFILVNNDGSDPVVGAFNGLPEGTLVNVNGGANQKRLTYVGGDGNDVVLADLVPPAVSSTVPSFTVSGTIEVGTKAIQVAFNEPVLNGAVATNYELRSAGADGLLGTGDDIFSSLSATYSSNTATLTFGALLKMLFVSP